MVLQGIDLLLSRAAKSDEKTGPVTVQFGGNGGDLNLSAVYDYMLFRFLPMLQELDPGKAKALLRDHDNVAALIKKYPDGMTSVAPGGSNYQSYSASPGETHFTRRPGCGAGAATVEKYCDLLLRTSTTHLPRHKR